jgi:membrane associated rhomboid family serine protease
MRPFQPPTTSNAVNWIVGVCVAVQLALTVGGDRFEETVGLAAGLIPARVVGDVSVATAVPALLTPVTSLFLHGGWFHLVMNMLFLLLVGRMTEWVLGPARLLALYFGAGLAGGALQVLADPSSTMPVVGASGAVAGVFAAYAVLFARQRTDTRRFAGITLSGTTVNALWLAAVWIGLQLMTGAIVGGIAIWAHIGGFVAGLLLIGPLRRGARALPL